MSCGPLIKQNRAMKNNPLAISLEKVCIYSSKIQMNFIRLLGLTLKKSLVTFVSTIPALPTLAYFFNENGEVHNARSIHGSGVVSDGEYFGFGIGCQP